ncbi:invasin, partial [Enterobacter bugandensis]
VDPAAEPQVSDLKLAGKLEAGQTLTATYAFAANGGNAQDKSTFAWGHEGTTGTAVADGQSVTTSGQVPGRALTSEDIGKVMELSVMAKNGAGTAGNTLTVNSSDAITAGSPVQANSGIKTDAATYMVGDDLKVTVTLKDTYGNPVTGQQAALTATSVTVPNAELNEGGGWTDNEDGTYMTTYTATATGTGLKATVKLSGWSSAVSSEAYAITAGIEPPASIYTQVNAYSFTQTSEEGTFPTTGFTGATFTVVPKDSKNASDYIWISDANWAPVEDGVVTFTGTGTGNKVTITGTPASGQGKTIKYSFTLKSWFINNGRSTLNWSDANAYCASQSGYRLPTVSELSHHNNYIATMARGIGALWNEWGDPTEYISAGFTGFSTWTSEQKSDGYHYGIDYYEGRVKFGSDSSTGWVTCRQGL